jgi:hypothetical protein
MSNNTQEHQLRLVLLDECGLFRASLGHLLTSENDLEVVGECGSSAEALEILKGSAVDVVLLDFNFGTEHVNDFISAARKAGYQGRFLVVTWSADVRNSAMALTKARRIRYLPEVRDSAAPPTGHQTCGEWRSLGRAGDYSTARRPVGRSTPSSRRSKIRWSPRGPGAERPYRHHGRADQSYDWGPDRTIGEQCKKRSTEIVWQGRREEAQPACASRS